MWDVFVMKILGIRDHLGGNLGRPRKLHAIKIVAPPDRPQGAFTVL